ncbi:RHS repeat domain-containing protein [Micromonospora sp. NPDC092111]|uniref:RHS repeat domain-containing protein n=1 Tax=Micromonospora sp. NPDC092111 TaxID=3364289 RepID=UPI0037FD46C6
MEPQLGLGYSSGAVDGRVASTNNQPSWAGEGFDLQSGFIERSYKACSQDGQPATIGDLCWGSNNAVVALPGATGELVRDDTTGQWRISDDEGWRVEQLTGAANGDAGGAGDQGEYWRLTSPDGTEYYFGLNHLPGWAAGKPETNSTWTVPVFGNQTGEPCYNASFAGAWCQQAYRWNLDYVVDPHGDAMSYFYAPETNYYGRNGTVSLPTPYTRGGTLARIEYGQRAGSLYTTPASARVVFTPGDRCIPGASCVQSQPQNWPDVPWDQACAASGSCQNLSPTFWSTKRLARIATQVYSGGVYRDVTSWTLTHSYPAPPDQTSAILWLDSIVQTGHVGGTVVLPAVTFDSLQWSVNRVDAPDYLAALYKRRLNTIYTETGGRISITYQPTECARVTVPAEDNNAKRCFPVYWGAGDTPMLDWFHKYVVSEVTEEDLVGGNPTEVTAYEYDIGGHAWHHEDAELVPASRKTWGQWRGFLTVRERTGVVGGARSLTEHVFMRGMNGDINKSGPADTNVTVDGIPDDPQWSGFARMTTTYDGDGGPWVEKTISAPEDIRTTAVRVRPGLQPLEAHLTAQKSEQTRTALAGGATRTTEVTYTYDPTYGTVTEVDDRGDVATPDDDTCTRTWYTRNAAKWIMDTESREETVGVTCSATPSYPVDLISDERSYYDGQATWGAAPTAGDVTHSDEAASWSGGPVYASTGSIVVDAHGRATEEYDVLGNKTSTAYTPATGGPVTQVATTNAVGHTSTTTLDPLLGAALANVDANSRRTDLTYDPLGRLTKVWLPGRAKATESPSSTFDYLVRADAPTAVVTAALLGNGSYLSEHVLYDGFLRPRQTQRSSPSGGRLVTDTFYDSHGRVDKNYAAYWDSANAPSAVLYGPTGTVPAETRYVYDGADREIAEVFLSNGVEQWRTSTAYGGDWTSETPPAGGTATMSITDADDHVVALRQYTGATPTGAYDETRYTYTKAGDLATVTDPAGNRWRYSYDLRGRKIRSEDPDAGTATYAYDDEDRLLSTTDGRGRTVAYRYDAVGRKTGMFDGSTSGTKLADWTYDTLPGGRGLATASTRYAGADRYVTETLGYDAAGRPTGSAVTIPGAAVGQTERYATTVGYDLAGNVTSANLPAVGSLGAESLRYTYNGVGLPATMSATTTTYVADTVYDALGDVDQYQLGDVGSEVFRIFGYEVGTRRLSTAQAIVLDPDADPTTAADVSYTYDPAGNITRIADAAVDDTQCFRYDHLRRLTEAWTTTDACSGAPSLSVLGGPAAYWHSYTFDKVGNRTAEVQHAAGGDTTRTYTYPAAGAAQPHTLRSVATTGPGGPRTDTFAYDQDGNTTSRAVAGKNQSLTWDAEGNLASVTEGANTTSFGYDANGNRIARRDSTGTTFYLGGAELFRPTSGGTLGTRYYSHNGETVAVRSAGNRLNWLVADHHGTATASIDAATRAVTHRYSSPYGGSRGTAPTGWPGQKGFVGGTIDAGIGLTQLGAREYDAATGRFISVDPIIDVFDPQQMHGYAYSNNSPVTYTDPDGLRPDCGSTKACANFNKSHTYNGKKYVKKPKPKVKPKPKARPAPKARSARDRLLDKDKQLDKRDKRGGVGKPKTKAAACDAKCRKESGCVGHNGCGPAGKARTSNCRAVFCVKRPTAPQGGGLQPKKALKDLRPIADKAHWVGDLITKVGLGVAAGCFYIYKPCSLAGASVARFGGTVKIAAGAVITADTCVNGDGSCLDATAEFLIGDFDGVIPFAVRKPFERWLDIRTRPGGK